MIHKESVPAPVVRLKTPDGSVTITTTHHDAATRSAVNVQLREVLTSILSARTTAEVTLDRRALTRWDTALSDLASAVFTINSGLIATAIRPFASNDRRNHREYEQVARAALWKAFTSFDPSKGKLYSWALIPVRRAVAELFVQTNYVGWKYSDFQTAHTVRTCRAALELRLGRPATAEEVSDYSGVSLASVNFVEAGPNQVACDLRYRYAGSSRRAGVVRMDLTVPDDISDEAPQERTVDTVADLLASGVIDDRQLAVLMLRFQLCHDDSITLPEIAAALGIGREIIRRQADSAVKALTSTTESAMTA